MSAEMPYCAVAQNKQTSIGEFHISCSYKWQHESAKKKKKTPEGQ